MQTANFLHSSDFIFWEWVSCLMYQKKSFSKTSFQLRMALKKGQKQGRDGRSQDHYPKPAKIHRRCRVVFCILSSLPCFCCLSGPSLTEIKLKRNFFPQFLFSFGYFLNQLSNRRQMWLCSANEHLQHRRRMLLALVMNTLVLEVNALKTCVQTSAPPAIQPATSNFQTKLISRSLLLTGTPLQKWVVTITFSYSPQSTLHPQVTCIYIIMYSAGLNGLQVD